MHLTPDDLAFVRKALAFWAPGVPAFAFGSRVHGRNLKTHSDLDICLRDAAPVPLPVIDRLRDAFSLSDLPMRVDLIDWHDLTDDFRAAIEQDLTPLALAE